MPRSLSPGMPVEYGGTHWQVLRVLDAESVLLRSETGEELAVDPLELRWPEPVQLLTGRSPRLAEELCYNDAAWAEATRDGGRTPPSAAHR
jgi:hypothetical protein